MQASGGGERLWICAVGSLSKLTASPRLDERVGICLIGVLATERGMAAKRLVVVVVVVLLLAAFLIDVVAALLARFLVVAFSCVCPDMSE